MKKNNQKALAFILAFSTVVCLYGLNESKNYAIMPEKPSIFEEKLEEDKSNKLKLKK